MFAIPIVTQTYRAGFRSKNERFSRSTVCQDLFTLFSLFYENARELLHQCQRFFLHV